MRLVRRLKIGPAVRALSTKSTRTCCERLDKRQLFRINGPDTPKFLQGLITNDIDHLDHRIGTGARSIYALLLNSQGRVLYDVIIHKTTDVSSPLEDHQCDLLVECDKASAPDLIKHLKIYRLRKKLEITDLSGELEPWVVFPDPEDFSPAEISFETHRAHDPETVTNVGCVEAPVVKDGSVYKDPRLTALGWRVILPKGSDCQLEHTADMSSSKYIGLRYKLGVGEGVTDLPPGNCFPLESNADYLHGVSFHKGCYIGQELTARTHHTGVIRKRLMPLVFDKPVEDDRLSPDSGMETSKGQRVGKFRGRTGVYGLGLLRVAESLAADCLRVKDVDNAVGTFKPFWWPVELPKESLIGKQ